MPVSNSTLANNRTDNNYCYTEEELIDGLKKKRSDAFSYLYKNYSATLYSVLLKILPDTLDAEDALQLSFIKIWNGIDSYDTKKSKLFTWMLNVTKNQAYDVLRSKCYKTTNLNQSLKDVEPSDAFNPFQKLDHLDIKHHITKLKTEQRTLVFLSFFYEFSHTQIAQMLNLPLGTVKTRLQKAYSVLRVELTPAITNLAS